MHKIAIFTMLVKSLIYVGRSMPVIGHREEER